MPSLVSDGAQFCCPFCTGPLTLQVAASPATGAEKKLATISNIRFPPPGGQCMVSPATPTPCTPSVVVVNTGQTAVSISGSLALGQGCQCICSKGGMLSAVQPGQLKVDHS